MTPDLIPINTFLWHWLFVTIALAVALAGVAVIWCNLNRKGF